MTFAGFDLDDDLRDLAALVADFVAREIVPAESALAPDARRLPDDVLGALREHARSIGLWCLDAPEEYGGGGLGAFESVVVWEQACKHRFCFPIAGGGGFGPTPPGVFYAGTTAQS